jgi:hypothetical protein
MRGRGGEEGEEEEWLVSVYVLASVRKRSDRERTRNCEKIK